MSLRCLLRGHEWGTWRLCPLFNGGRVRYCDRCRKAQRR